MNKPRGFVLEVTMLAMAVFFGVSVCASGCFGDNAINRIHALFGMRSNAAPVSIVSTRGVADWLVSFGGEVVDVFLAAIHAPRSVPAGSSAIQQIVLDRLASTTASTEALFSPFASGSPAETILRTAAPLIEAPLPLAQGHGEKPIKIVIDGANVSSSVSNPNSTDMSVLESALLKGAVRFPTTSLLGENGTMLIFGHSSYMPKIHNPAYRTFDGVQNLPKGAIVHVYSATTDYQYAVRDIKIMDAADASANTIPLPDDKQYLVIDTCDTFASKSSRFVVTADFVRAEAL
ncbi:MAG TPA: sortase [Candidatus Paceibacterota bacterium]